MAADVVDSVAHISTTTSALAAALGVILACAVAGIRWWQHPSAAAAPVLRHRILLNFEGQAEGITTDALVHHLLESLRA